MSAPFRVAVIMAEGTTGEEVGRLSKGGNDVFLATDARGAASAGADAVVVLGPPGQVAKTVADLAAAVSQLAVVASLRPSEDGDALVALARELESFGPDQHGLSGPDAESLSHDLRSPLGSILLRVGRLLSLCADERLKACEAFEEFPRQLEIVRREAERCAGLLAVLDRSPGA